MKKPTYPYNNKIFTRIWAILLLVLFVNAILIETLHHHEVEKTSYSNYQSKSDCSPKQLGTAKLKCKLCELQKHRSHFFDFPTPITFALPIVKPNDRTAIYLLKHTAAFILSYSNKGPPGKVV